MNAIVGPERSAAEEIKYAYAATSLGRVLVAVAAEGVAAILIGDGREELGRELADAFPQAALRLDEAGLAPVAELVRAYLEAPKGEIGLKLALRGSAVERAVWQALRAIPYGRTATYGEIAKIAAARRHRAGGWRGLRRQPARGRDSLPPRDQGRRIDLGLSLGRAAQADADRQGSRGMSGAGTAQVAAVDWAAVAAALDVQGWAVLPKLLSADQCEALAGLYDAPAGFRSRVVMARHGFGRGEYRYFAYPLPPLVESLRTRPLRAARADRQSLARSDGDGGALPRRPCRLPRALPRREPDATDAAAASLWAGRL